MKKVIYILSAVGLLTLGACNDQLETNPTDKVSGTIIFSDANGAETAMNGIYRATSVDTTGSIGNKRVLSWHRLVLQRCLKDSDHLRHPVLGR